MTFAEIAQKIADKAGRDGMSYADASAFANTLTTNPAKAANAIRHGINQSKVLTLLPDNKIRASSTYMYVVGRAGKGSVTFSNNVPANAVVIDNVSDLQNAALIRAMEDGALTSYPPGYEMPKHRTPARVSEMQHTQSQAQRMDRSL